jgi:hypothetical protein
MQLSMSLQHILLPMLRVKGQVYGVVSQGLDLKVNSFGFPENCLYLSLDKATLAVAAARTIYLHPKARREIHPGSG